MELAALLPALQSDFLLPLSAASMWLGFAVSGLLFMGWSLWLLKDSSCCKESEATLFIMKLQLYISWLIFGNLLL